MPRLYLLFLLIALPAVSFASTLEKLEQEITQKKYSQATSTGIKLLREQPENSRALFLTALAFQQNNQPEQAQRYYLRMIKMHPELPEPKNNLAMIYLQQGQYDQAVDQLIESLNTHPAYSTAWKNLSNLYKGLASEAYRKALSEENNTTSVMHNIQLTALTHLHSAPISTIAKPVKPIPANPIPVKPIMVATVTQKSEYKSPVVKTIKPKTPVKPAKAIKPINQEKILTAQLQQWAEHWSNKNFKAYINAYSSSYKGNKPSHKAWTEYRRSRIKRPGNLHVKLNNIRIKSQGSRSAVVDFDQSYRSDTYQDKVRKRVKLIQTRDGWKISYEKTLAVL